MGGHLTPIDTKDKYAVCPRDDILYKAMGEIDYRSFPNQCRERQLSATLFHDHGISRCFISAIGTAVNSEEESFKNN